MQAVCSTGLKGAALATRPNRTSLLPPRSAARAAVVCKAQIRPLAAAAAALPALLAHPAFAVVDQRLYGEGTSKPLGIDTVEAFPILLVFGLVWAFFYSAANGKELDKNSRGQGEDSGLSL